MPERPDLRQLRAIYTPAEVEQMLYGPPAQSLNDLIDELEREYLGELKAQTAPVKEGEDGGSE